MTMASSIDFAMFSSCTIVHFIEPHCVTLRIQRHQLRINHLKKPSSPHSQHLHLLNPQNTKEQPSHQNSPASKLTKQLPHTKQPFRRKNQSLNQSSHQNTNEQPSHQKSHTQITKTQTNPISKLRVDGEFKGIPKDIKVRCTPVPELL